jgi:chromosome partitioning protein
MKKIVFFNTKGGTGKSTVCFNYGWYLAEYCKKRILLLDFDPQISLTQSFYKISSIPENKCLEKLVVNFIKKNEINIDDYIIKVNNHIDLIPSSNNLSLLDEYLTEYLLDKVHQEKKLYLSDSRNRLIKEVLDKYIDPGKYDYVLIDSQPNYSLLSASSIIFAQNIVLVLKPELFSFLDIKYLTRIVKNLEEKFEIKINIVGMLINAYEKRRKTSEAIVNRLNQDYSKEFHIIQQKIRYLSYYQLSIVQNSKPVFLIYPNSLASLDLLDAFGELDKLIDIT